MCATHHAFDARAKRLGLGRVARDGLSMGPLALGGAPGCDGQCAGRCQVAVALSAVASCDRLTVPVGCFAQRTWVGGVEALHGTWVVVEEWRSIATRDGLKLRLLATSVNRKPFTG